VVPPITPTSTASRTGRHGKLWLLGAKQCPPPSVVPTKTAPAGNDTRAVVSRSASARDPTGTSPAGPLPGLRSCAGDHAGAWLVAVPTTPALHVCYAQKIGPCGQRRQRDL
jgi:hypothetical protein